ncbi:aKG-HExxH-type peptide beta-hydroxylase [Nocardia sp. NPDC049149]|uniref:aKG-HExxH-type peptide beta-hydroxylase n=1 Tax=Nocardia sp. NPDC049149 TaxID=3364315 RepID=UPI00371586F9
MYYTNGFEECLTTLVVLASAATSEPIRSEQDLAAGVHAFIQSANTEPAAPGPLHVVDDEIRLRTLARQFGREPSPASSGPLAAPAESVVLFWEGLALLPEPAQRLFRLVVTEVALFDGAVVVAGSGAMVEQMSTIYVAPGPRWSSMDIAECLVHEMTHLLLRCDEHRFGHYVDPTDAVREQEFSRTAVSLTLRSPLVAFHSLIVAAEIMGVRADVRTRVGHASIERGGAHGPDHVLVRRALQCADELLRRPDRNSHFVERAVMLMERATSQLESAFPAEVR